MIVGFWFRRGGEKVTATLDLAQAVSANDLFAGLQVKSGPVNQHAARKLRENVAEIVAAVTSIPKPKKQAATQAPAQTATPETTPAKRGRPTKAMQQAKLAPQAPVAKKSKPAAPAKEVAPTKTTRKSVKEPAKTAEKVKPAKKVAQATVPPLPERLKKRAGIK